MTTSEQSTVLPRLRRYQQLVVMGGGAVITLVVLIAGLMEVAASVNAYLARMKEEVSIDMRRSMDFTTRAVATLNNNVQNMEVAWASADADGQGREASFGADGVLRVQPDPDGPPLLVVRGTDAAPQDESWRYIRLARMMAAATARIAARNAGDLTVYLYSPDHQTMILSVLPWGGVDWQDQVAADRAGLFAALTTANGQAIAPPEGGWREASTGAARFRWLPPYQSPLTGKRAVRIATELTAWDGEPFGTLVYEMPLQALASHLPETSFAGSCMLLTPDGDLITQCQDTPEAPAASGASGATGAQDAQNAQPLAVARQALAEGLDDRTRNMLLDGYVLSGWPLRPTGWTLVHAHPWSEIASGVRPQILLALLTSALIILLTWALLLVVKWRVFVPAVRQSQRVFDSEQLSRTLVETAPVGLGLITAHSGQPLLCSPAMIDTASRVVVDGPGLSSALSQHYLTQERTLPAGASPDTAVFKDDLTFATRDGQRLDLSVSMVRARYQGEDVLVTAFTDVTANKQLELELRNARQAADSANAAKSAFLAAMSHEIRTPLNAVLGNLELLAYSPLDPVQRDRLNTIRTASDGLLAVVSDVLDFSKIEAGELQLEALDFDVLALTAQTLMVFAPVARAKGLVLVGDLGDALTWPMRGDPARLGQIINNLLSNAIKFTESGQVTLRVSRDEAAAQLRIEVEDTGIGMRPEQLAVLFQDFTQADATINRRFGGTGLGLALCQRLATAMGGTLGAQSQPGVGSRFTLCMPLGGAAPAAGAGDGTPRFDGEPVLLVAASQAERVRLGGLLKSWGLDVTPHAHPATVNQADVEDVAALVIWGDRQTWHPNDENALVEDASWVVDCSEEGPAEPVASGRVVSTSVYGVRGLAKGLRYALQGEALSASQPGGMALGKRLRVLVAEDNVVNRKLFEEQLALLGCEATTVVDAAQALARLEQETFDVLLTDLSMPGQDGFALARQTRQRWPAMPVVAATANVTPQQRVAGERVGMAKVLGKPLSLADLGAALSEVAGLPHLPGGATADTGLLGGRAVADDTRLAFEQSCRDAVESMMAGLRDNDAARLRAELHSLGGACAVFCLNDLAARGAALSSAISERGVDACADDIYALCDALLAAVLHEPQHLLHVADQIIARLDACAATQGEAAGIAELARTLRASLNDQQG